MSPENPDLLFQRNTLKKESPRKYPLFSAKEAARVVNFHKSMPIYRETPIHEMEQLAVYLEIDKLWIKDESKRFDLSAYHFLGASYGLAKWIALKGRQNNDTISFDRMAWLLRSMKDFVIVAAADANHGYGVAYLAKLCGCKAKIFLSQDVSESKLERIRKVGGDVELLDLSYDQTIIHAKEQASKNGWLLLQNTTVEADESLITYIMQGYLTLACEAYEQLGEQRPTHIILQAGIGSMAAALQAYLCNRFGANAPIIIIVEPRAADCFYGSHELQNGQSSNKLDDNPIDTVMTGLNNGIPSRLAWPILRDESYAFISCRDKVSYLGMRVLNSPLQGDPRLLASEAGALSLGSLFKICNEELRKDIKDQVSLDENSRVLLVLTEGPSDMQRFQKGIWEDVFT
ncbi:MAG: diaminopropionate ammonia-lyase [Oligoflexales bacterium]